MASREATRYMGQKPTRKSEVQFQDTEHNTLIEVVKAYADATSSLHTLQVAKNLLSAAQAVLANAQQEHIRSWPSGALRVCGSWLVQVYWAARQ